MNEYVHEKVRQFKYKKICQTNISWKILQIILLQFTSQSYGGKTFIFTNRNSNLLRIHLQSFRILPYILHILTGEYSL
jgi:hypothetical protein